MGSVLAIISKAQFEKLAGKNPTLGTVLDISEYTSTHKALEPLAEGGWLYLVTVRPPDDALWLVGVLLTPELSDGAWRADPNTCPMTDISNLKARIRFASGTGMMAKPGTLGMSLQTPRLLAKNDDAVLTNARNESLWAHEARAGKAAKPAAKTAKPAAMGGKPTKPAKAAAKLVKAAKLSGVLATLIDASIRALEEALPDPKADKLLRAPKWQPSYGLRGTFTDSAQGIFEGAIDMKECCRMMDAELAPFVDGPALAMALRYVMRKGAAKAFAEPDDFFGELVDQFAIRAVDDMARGLLALALDRRADVPDTCAALVPALETRVDEVKALTEA